MLGIIINAILVGISTGPSCLILCSPFFLPYLITEKRKLKVNFLEFLEFLLGRLVGYLAFGLVVGYLGKKINIGWVNMASTISLGILSLLIILYSFHFFKLKFCALKFKKIKLPFFIGLLTGINLCPPFLLSLNYVFILGNILQGLVYFFFFFLATNIYFIPLVFLGQLSYFKEFQTLARWTLIIVGTIFLFYALYSLLTHQYIFHII